MKTKTKLFVTAIITMMIGTLAAAEVAAQSYNFKPPQNNFYVKYRKEGRTCFYGYINGEIWSYDTGSEYPVFVTSKGKVYEYINNKWAIDPEAFYSPEDIQAWKTQATTAPPMLSEYYTRFWKAYNQQAASGKLNPKLFHLGKERFLGVDCDIFKDEYGGQIRYWIDPSNGCTLKLVADGKTVDKETIEVLEYNLKFTAWPAGIPTGR
jgi:hypothetical protein